ncbi:MAG: hypothetical protein AB1921_06595 [Thermodesulfobacteriota bacterium]
MTTRNTAGAGVFFDRGLNGIGFRAPEDLRVVQVEKRLLRLAGPDGLVLVLSWLPGPVRMSPRKALSLARKAAARRDLCPWPLPEAWRASVPGYRAFGFSQGASGPGRGVVLACRDCGGVVLAYFLPASGVCLSEEMICKILASMSDHPPGPGTPLALFDIRARVPAGFALASARFDAGFFRMAFSRKKDALFLCRLAPASAVLARTGLANLAQEIFPETAGGSFELSGDGENACQALIVLPRRLFSPQTRIACRIWRPVDRNRILGVMLQSGNPEDEFRFACSHYEIL